MDCCQWSSCEQVFEALTRFVKHTTELVTQFTIDMISYILYMLTICQVKCEERLEFTCEILKYQDVYADAFMCAGANYSCVRK